MPKKEYVFKPYRVDGNQKEIVEALRAAGATVRSTAHVGYGFPDLVVGVRGQNFLLEVKTPKGKLEESQERFHANWGGSVVVVRSVEEALAACGL